MRYDFLVAWRDLRFGFGYDIEYTMKGLARVDGTLADVVSSVASHAT